MIVGPTEKKSQETREKMKMRAK